MGGATGADVTIQAPLLIVEGRLFCYRFTPSFNSDGS